MKEGQHGRGTMTKEGEEDTPGDNGGDQTVLGMWATMVTLRKLLKVVMKGLALVDMRLFEVSLAFVERTEETGGKEEVRRVQLRHDGSLE